jgi:hypothetical protein
VGDSEQSSNKLYKRCAKGSIVLFSGSQRSLDNLVKGGIMFFSKRK